MTTPNRYMGFTIYPCGRDSYAGSLGYRYETRVNVDRATGRYYDTVFWYGKTQRGLMDRIKSMQYQDVRGA